MLKNMMSTIKYHLNQLRHFPFDINIGKVNFYCYYHGNNERFYKNLTNDKFYGRNAKLRINICLFGYTLDFNILKW
jgi:hypothetical protein